MTYDELEKFAKIIEERDQLKAIIEKGTKEEAIVSFQPHENYYANLRVDELLTPKDSAQLAAQIIGRIKARIRFLDEEIESLEIHDTRLGTWTPKI